MKERYLELLDERFEDDFIALTGYSIDRTVVHQWAEAKDDNPVINTMFKDSLIIGKPVVYKPDFSMNIIEDKKLFYSASRAAFSGLLKDAERLLEELGDFSYCVIHRYSLCKYAPKYTNIRYLMEQYEREVTDEQLKLLQIYSFIYSKEEEIFASFMGTEARSYEGIYLDILGVAPNQGEKLYRFLKRVIRTFFGKESLYHREYDNLLSYWSTYKRINLSKKGYTLCLSIHPQDYLTVSQGNNWETCFAIEGEFRSSISATMLSRDSVVTYILKDEDYEAMITRHEIPDKVWRTFVIINPAQLYLTQTYPFYSKQLFGILHEWVQELSGIKYNFETGDKEELPFFPPDSMYGYINSSYCAKILYEESSWFVADGLDRIPLKWRSLDFMEIPVFLDTGESMLDFIDDNPVYAPGNLSSCMFSFDVPSVIECDSCGGGIYEDEEDYFETDIGFLCESCYDRYLEKQRREEEDEYDNLVERALRDREEARLAG